MAITIKQVATERELKEFVQFNYRLYQNHPYAVPDLQSDILNTFDPKENAAFDFCEAQCFLAYDGDTLVGRVAAIINRRANDIWNTRTVRFGWIDFTDNPAVSAALISAVEQWGKERGMDTIKGPLGFTDLDNEGMLVEGFDQLSTMATIYNYPYYPQHMEKLGFEKDADWVEFKIQVPPAVPEKMQRISDLVSRKFGLHVKKLKNMREIKEGGYGHKIFDLVNRSYAELYGFSPMTDKQIEHYIKTYLPILDLRMVTLIENEQNEVVCVGISMASVSRALQKAKGKLFPFGWYHLLKALFVKRPETLDLLLVGVAPEYQSKGVNAMLFADLIPVYNKLGFKNAESNPELEDNGKVQAQWDYFETTQHKRRRAYKKAIN